MSKLVVANHLLDEPRVALVRECGRVPRPELEVRDEIGVVRQWRARHFRDRLEPPGRSPRAVDGPVSEPRRVRRRRGLSEVLVADLVLPEAHWQGPRILRGLHSGGIHRRGAADRPRGLVRARGAVPCLCIHPGGGRRSLAYTSPSGVSETHSRYCTSLSKMRACHSAAPWYCTTIPCPGTRRSEADPDAAHAIKGSASPGAPSLL